MPMRIKKFPLMGFVMEGGIFTRAIGGGVVCNGAFGISGMDALGMEEGRGANWIGAGEVVV